MRKIAAGLALALIGWAVFLITNTAAGPTPNPVTPPSPENPYSTVCPPPTETTAPVHPATRLRRGAPCPQVTSTVTGGDST